MIIIISNQLEIYLFSNKTTYDEIFKHKYRLINNLFFLIYGHIHKSIY